MLSTIDQLIPSSEYPMSPAAETTKNLSFAKKIEDGQDSDGEPRLVPNDQFIPSDEYTI